MNRASKFFILWVFGVAAACGTKESPRENSSDCSTQGAVNGRAAVAEVDAMVNLISVGSRCQLKGSGEVGAYELLVSDGRTLKVAFDAATPDSAIGATREICSGVPYWRVTTQAVTVNDIPAKFRWAVREDKNETLEFSLEATEPVTSVALSDCR